MQSFNRQKHWENIYKNKEIDEVSWYQPIPETSIEFIENSHLPKTAKIIDVGGGDSFLVDHLLERGYTDITVLDISEAAINRAKKRLGEKAGVVKWIHADAASFKPEEYYDIWHDRAAFHFLTDDDEISRYIEIAQQYIKPSGTLVVGTFSEQGPTKCSGIEIKQYSEHSMTQRFGKYFQKVKCLIVDHKTPSDTVQNFVFCAFRRRE